MEVLASPRVFLTDAEYVTYISDEFFSTSLKLQALFRNTVCALDQSTKEIITSQTKNALDVIPEELTVSLYHKNLLKDSLPTMNDVIELIEIYKVKELNEFYKTVRVFVECKMKNTNVNLLLL